MGSKQPLTGGQLAACFAIMLEKDLLIIASVRIAG